MVIIYVLIDPTTKEVRYVGATSRTLNQRLSAHLTDARKNRGTYKVNWINSLLANNLNSFLNCLIKFIAQYYLIIIGLYFLNIA